MADDTLALPDVLDGFSLNDTGSGIWTPSSSFLTDALRFPFNLADGFPSPPNEISDTSHRRTRKRRGKAYTGCLTCRTRKIKCDGIRPVCSNCQRSRHYVCHGYVEPLGEAAAGDDTEQRGRPRKAPKTRAPVSADHLPGRIHENRPRTPPSQSYHEPAPGQEPRDPVGGDTPDIDLNVEVDVDEDSVSLSTESCNSLFAHYQNVACHLLMPTIDHSRNPYLQVLVPMALQDSPSASQLALRYALLAVSAIHASGIPKHPSGVDQELAQRLQEKAKRLILAALNEQQADSIDSDTLDKCALLGGATILISADVFSGESRDSISSINLAKHVFRKTGGDAFWKHNPEPSVLYQLLRCHDIIASTANIDSPRSATESLRSSPMQHDVDDPGMALSNDLQENALLPLDHYILDTSFGISMHTISLLGQVIHLSSECARSPWSSGIQATARTLQQALHNFNENTTTLTHSEYKFTTRSSSNATTLNPTLPSLPLVPTLPPAVRDELLHNHLWAFHYAAILFFYRVIHPHRLDDNDATLPHTTSNTISTDFNGQKYVEYIVERLENIDALTHGDEICPANTLWPAFIAGCEAVNTSLRRRVLIWLTRAAGKGLRNVLSAKRLIMEVWRRVDRCASSSYVSGSGSGFESRGNKDGLGGIDWRTVMREMELSFNLC